MKFEIEFHGPFRVAAGHAAPGVDVSVDLTSLLPESSLKGVMRSAANQLGVAASLVAEVFGTAAAGSAWAWLPVTYATEPLVTRRARTPIDAESGTVVAGALLMAHEVWTSSATFHIEHVGRLDDATRQRHLCVLALAARGVRSLGGTRNRGLGWVTITALDPPAMIHDSGALLALLDAS